MGSRRIALAFIASFLLALALTAEASTHESFSASSFYEADSKPKDPTETTGTTEDPYNRFPNGYPGQEHHYNPVTEKYDADLSKTTTETGTLPTEETTETTTIPNRYAAGYTHGPGNMPSSFQHYTTENQPGNQPDKFTFDPTEGRYKAGYFRDSTYAGAALKTSTTVPNNGVSLTVQNSNQLTNSLQGDFANRYNKGYFPESTYTQQGFMYNKQQTEPVTYNSYTGQFSTMPYPSSGVPFVASGAGCRTAYWVENVHMWPSFFTVKTTVGDAFGAQATATYGLTTMLQGLMKYGDDPFNELLRTGLTSLLNAYARGAFKSSHMKVIEEFNAACVSPDAAKTQALVFETQNVESISAGSACT